MLNLIDKYFLFFWFNLHRAYMHFRLKSFANKINGTILDIGAGDQPYKNLFTFNKYITTNTKKHYKNNTDIDKFTDVWIDDASLLPFESNEMDAVFCFQVISVIQNPASFFAEVKRVLKPGGKLLLTSDWLYPSWSNEDKARYSEIELRKLASNAGLKVITTEGFGGIRSLHYMLQSRWVRGYYRRIKIAKGMQKFKRIIQWIYYACIAPIYYLKGVSIFMIEKNVSNNTEVTFNLLLFAENTALPPKV